MRSNSKDVVSVLSICQRALAKYHIQFCFTQRPNSFGIRAVAACFGHISGSGPSNTPPGSCFHLEQMRPPAPKPAHCRVSSTSNDFSSVFSASIWISLWLTRMSPWWPVRPCTCWRRTSFGPVWSSRTCIPGPRACLRMSSTRSAWT